MAEIAGKSMIHWVYSHCSEANDPEGNSAPKFDVAVVTDHQEIENHVKDFGGKVIRIDEDVPSGTERIFLGWQRYYRDLEYDLIINVQGDEPLLRGEDLRELAEFHFSSDYHVSTLVRRETDMDEFTNPNRVKVVFSRVNGHCFYFSRAPIPFDREGEQLKEWWLHIGVYAYNPKALELFCRHPHAFYENMEKLEQLRALEVGLRIGAMQTERQLVGVDVPEDVKKLEGVLK